jgi:DNA-binding response OmpR family regulator
MSFATSSDGHRPYRVLLVRTDLGDSPAPPTAFGSGLISYTTHGGPIDDGPPPDVIVVDFAPDRPIDFSLYNRIHREGRGRPIVVVGPRQDMDCILSLELGADDYLPKPYAVQELTARIRAILRRRDGKPAAVEISGLLVDQDFDIRRRCLVAPDGRMTRLSTVEFELLRYLVTNPFSVHSRENLAFALYHRQDRHYELRSIDVFVNALRQKLKDAPPYRLIRTERGQGYMFTPAARVED